MDSGEHDALQRKQHHALLECISSEQIVVVSMISCITVIFILHHMICALAYRSKGRTVNDGRPPCPWRIPFLGNLHHLFLLKPLLEHQALAHLARQYGPIMRFYLGSRTALFVSNYAAAQSFFQANERHFASRPYFKFYDWLLYGHHNGVAFSSYSPRWKKMRRFCILQLFTPQRIMSSSKIIEEEVALVVNDVCRLCRSSEDGSVSVNVAHLAHLVVSNIMGRLTLSKRMCDTHANGETLIDMFKRTNDAIVPAMTDFLPPILGLLLDFKSKRRMIQTHKHIDAFWTLILEERQGKQDSANACGDHWSHADFLGALLSDKEVMELGDDNIKATLMDILGAGSETSSITIEWAMAELLRNPGCLSKLRSELDETCQQEDILHVPAHLSFPILGSRWARKHVLLSSSSPSLISSSQFPSSASGTEDFEACTETTSSLRCPSYVSCSRVSQMPYLRAVIKETLRLHPPVPLLIPRGISAPDEVAEQHGFEHEAILFLNAWAIGRDEEVWQHPELFKPERFIDEGSDSSRSSSIMRTLPFGTGRRRCPGMPLAMCIMELTLAAFARNFEWEIPTIETQKTAELDMSEKSGSAGTHKAKPLEAVLRPRLIRGLEHRSQGQKACSMVHLFKDEDGQR